VKQAVVGGRYERRGGREQGGLSQETRRLPGVVGSLVAQEALTDRGAGLGAQRHVEEDEVAPAPQDPRLRHHILFSGRGEVLHREIDNEALAPPFKTPPAFM
jgi:hypothetical protein